MDANEMNPNNVPIDPRGGGDDDDDFGEFEGFEGDGVEPMQAQPAPSPWATFPDLLPVQTSPATPADEGQSSSRNIIPNRENMWRPSEPLPWMSLANNVDNRPVAVSVRVLNPPDVSLGTNQGASGRITPDNVHDAAHAEGMNHIDARLPVVQLDLLQQQLGDAEQSRAALEDQVNQLQQRNVELEAEITSSQAQINDLSTRLQQNQEALEQRLSEMRNFSNNDLRRDMQQLQEEIRALRGSQTKAENNSSTQQVEQIRKEVVNKFHNLESTLRNEYQELEQNLTARFTEEFHQMRSTIEKIVQESMTGALSHIVKDSVQKKPDHCLENSLTMEIKEELKRHEEQQRKALEEESKRQLSVVSAALQSALQHISGAVNNTPKKAGEGEKS